MADLDSALSRLGVALDALDSRLSGALGNGKAAREATDEIARLKEERSAMQEEIERLKSEVRALDDLHDDMSARLDAAMREVQSVLAE